MKSRVIDIAEELIRRPSVTPQDHGCQEFMIEQLTAIGFDCEKMDFHDTENFWATRGQTGPCFIFAGHTDVVPAGDLEQWQTDPFEPTHQDGMLYGRGAADMKGSLAAMLVATEQFVSQYPEHRGTIGFLITSDEEGPYINGTVKVVAELMRRKQSIDFALVGEPSSTTKLGDVIKKGRRGSLTGWATVQGIQGHVAYPHLAKNAVHECLLALAELSAEQWDHGNQHFPPTSFQITNVSAGTGAGNVVPGKMNLEFNFRYSTEQTHETLMQQVIDKFNAHDLKYDLRWNLNGEPFLTADGDLLAACKATIKDQLGIETSAETSGGTSDGRFIAKTGAQVIELGPINATIHKVNECVSTSDLELLVELYFGILKRLLVD